MNGRKRFLARLPGTLSGGRPSSAAVLAALVCIAWAFGYVFSQETPVGSVRGQVILDDSNRPLAGVEIYLRPLKAKGRARQVRYTLTGEDGKFLFTHVPAGTYNISATSRAHNASDTEITVDEGGTTPVILAMQRSESELAMKWHQRVFGTVETAHVAVSGYVDEKKPARQDALRVRVFHTRLSTVLQNAQEADSLEQVGRSYDAINHLPDVLLSPPQGPAPQRIVAHDVRVTEADKEGFFYQKIDFGRLGTGLYLVDVAHAGQTVCAWVLVTDTALVVKRARRQMVAYAVNMQTGTPLPGTDIRTYRSGRVVAQGQTDGRGLAELTMPSKSQGDEGNSTPIMTIAARGMDEAVVSGSVYQSEDAGRYTVHAYTDRPLYRPGQRIDFKGIVRRDLEPETDSGARYGVPSGEPVRVEIRDPSGERILEQTLTTNAYGSFWGFVDLNPEAPTGIYNLVMRVRGEEHTHDIVVASYRKPEFAVTVTPDKTRYTRGETVTMTVSGQYYFGAPVAGATVSYSVYRAPDWSAEFPDDYGYDAEDDRPPHFADGESYYGASVADGEATLDGDGKAVLTFRTDRDMGKDAEPPQEEIYTANVTVKEGEDREVMADGVANVTSGDFRLTISPEGYVARPGQPTSVILSASDFDHHPVPNIAVDLGIGYQQWKGDKYEYQSAGVQKAVTGSDGRVVVTVTPPHAGELLLRARATDAEQHAVLGRAFLWATGDEGGDLETQYNDLSLLTDKRRYQPGDTARVLINAARAGETVLLTIEGQKVYRMQLVPMQKRSTVVRVPVLARYGPNVFLAACYVRDKHYASSETPLRVAMPQQEMKVAVTADRETPTANNRPNGQAQPTLARYQPGDRITYHVRTTDAQGHPAPAEFSLGVVDESIYALQEDNPTALREAFYPRRTNEVTTSYSFAVEYLGDADKAEPKIAARKKFPDTAFWKPDLRTDADGHATVTFALPDNLTTWRATVTAQTTDTKLGRAIDKVIAAKDFFVRVEMPRFLTQHDASRIVAFVHNDTNAPQTAMVRIRADNLTLTTDATRRLSIEPGKAQEASWPVTADGFGTAHLRVTTWTIRSGAGAQYTDGVELTLPVRPHGREDLVAFAGELTSANPETEVVRLDPKVIPGASRLTIRITPSVATALTGAVDYLVGYPYGCTEQTMSRFLPDLLVQRALRLNGISGVRQANDLPRMVRNGLQRLYRFQHRESGGWGWWEHDSDDPWMTAYVLYGLGTAQAEGYPVSKDVLASGRKAAVRLLAKTRPDDQPFLLYALALAGGKEGAQSARSQITLKGMGPEGFAYLILLDTLLGRSSSEAQAALDSQAVSADQMVHWGASTGTFDWDDSEATAVSLRAVLAVDPHDPRIGPILRWLMARRTGDYWSSTRDTSCVLAALCDYLTTQPASAATGEVHIRLNGRLMQTYRLTPDLRRETDITLHIPASALRPEKNDVTLDSTPGTSPVFYSVALRQTVAMEDMPALASAQLGVQREYLRLRPQQAGIASWTLQTEPTNNRLQQGDRIRVRLTLTVPRDMAYVLIEDPFPAGCEVMERGDAEEVVEWGYWWSSIDVRDDRIAFFARTLSKGTHTIEYNLRAQTPGSYHTLPTLLQAMYAPETRAESEEARVEVR